MSATSMLEAARRKIAAPQLVIVSERRSRGRTTQIGEATDVPLPPPLPIPDWRALERMPSQTIPDWRGVQRSISDWRRVQGDRVAPPPSAVSFFNDLTALCLCPSARTPPRGRRFVANKRANAFDRPVTDRSKPLFCLVSRLNQVTRRYHRRVSNCHRERAAKSGSPANAFFVCWGEEAGSRTI